MHVPLARRLHTDLDFFLLCQPSGAKASDGQFGYAPHDSKGRKHDGLNMVGWKILRCRGWKQTLRSGEDDQ